MERRPRRKRAERVAGVLDRMLRRSGLHAGMRERRALMLWPEVAGPALTRVTEPLYLNQGTLVVRVSGASWRAELHHLLPELLGRLNARLDQPLREIKLVSGPRRRAEASIGQPGLRPRPTVGAGDTLSQLIERARRAQQHSGGNGSD